MFLHRTGLSQKIISYVRHELVCGCPWWAVCQFWSHLWQCWLAPGAPLDSNLKEACDWPFEREGLQFQAGLPATFNVRSATRWWLSTSEVQGPNDVSPPNMPLPQIFHHFRFCVFCLFLLLFLNKAFLLEGTVEGYRSSYIQGHGHFAGEYFLLPLWWALLVECSPYKPANTTSILRNPGPGKLVFTFCNLYIFKYRIHFDNLIKSMSWC